MVPPPIVLGLTFCEKVIVEEGTRNITLVRTFSRLFFDEFPATAQPFTVYAVLTDGLGDGILDSDEEIDLHRGPVRFPNRLAEARLRLRVDNWSFAAPGRYLFSLLLDGEWLAHRVLRVYAREVGS